MTDTPLLKVAKLSKWFPLKAGNFTGPAGTKLRAVHNVSFSLAAGRTLGLVGESGCGKSTTGRLILRLIEPTAGSIELDGEDITHLRGGQLKAVRRRMQIIFQDPLGSLNPRLNIGRIIAEPLAVHNLPRSERGDRIAELLQEVELPIDTLRRFPHEFSGGQRQRVAIARALALRPELIIADEPVSALDASIQAQILTLLRHLQDTYGMAYLFISHDLAVVRHLCHDVAVMYLGEIVESGNIDQVYHDPHHPYTKALMAAIPRAEPDAVDAEPLAGQLPDATNPPPGCSFASRCPHADTRCRSEAPPVFDIGAGHYSRCWLNESAAAASG